MKNIHSFCLFLATCTMSIIERLFMQDHVSLSFCVLKSIWWTLFIYCLFSFSCSSYSSLLCLMQNLMQKFNASMTDCLHWFECLGIHLLPCCHFKYLSYWSTCLKAAVSRRAANVKGPSLFSCRVTLEASQRQQLHKP